MLLKMIMLLKFKPSKVDGKHAPLVYPVKASVPPGVERSAEVSSCKTLKIISNL